MWDPSWGTEESQEVVGLVFRVRESGLPEASGVASWLMQPSNQDTRTYGETSWVPEGWQQFLIYNL